MKWSILPLVLSGLLLVYTDGQQTVQQETCSKTGHEATIEPDADAFIGGLFGMHSPQPGSNVGCGPISSLVMQSYEAIRFVIDRMNKKGEVLNGQFLNDTYVPGVKIGMIVRDYCENEDTVVANAEELFPQFSRSKHECSKVNNKLMLGLIGAQTSDDTKRLEKFAEDNNLPLISYAATAPELSDVEVFPNFLRTVPPDGPLTQTIVKYIEQLTWKYVVVVYTDNSYGRGAYRSIQPQLAEAGICLTAKIVTDPNDVSDATMDGIFRQLLQTETTGVIYLGNNVVIHALLKKGETYTDAMKLQWILSDSVSLSENFPNQKYPRGLISVVPAARKIIEFEDHWVRIDRSNPSTENPWYQAAYMELHKCKLPGVTSTFTTPCAAKSEDERRQEFVQDQFVEPAVHAVYTYVHALKEAHQQLCNGVPGMCASLKSLKTEDFYNNYVKKTDFFYTKVERVESMASYSLDPYNMAAHVAFKGNDIVDPAFQIYNFNNYPQKPTTTFKFRNIGNNINNLLEIVGTRQMFYDETRTNRLVPNPKSDCPGNKCAPCLGFITEPKYVYIPGDVVINGMFSVHNQGTDPLSCGALDMTPAQAIQHVEAFIYSINQANKRGGILDGVTIGGLGFDDCMSVPLSNQLITEVQHYSRKIVDENGENPLNPNTVEMYMTSTTPSLAVSLAEMMNALKRPVMGVGVLPTWLNNKDNYPFFIRSLYDMEYVARAIVNVAKRNGWKYIQSVHHDGPYGLESNDILKRIAAEEGICIVASYVVESVPSDELVMRLQARRDVQPLVLLLSYNGFRKVMEGIKQKNAGSHFQLISLIGDSKRSVEDYGSQAVGMISIELWAPPMKDYIDFHLKTIDAKTYKTNPWMMEWYEAFYECKMDGSGKACPTTNMFQDNEFEFNTDVVSTLYGMRAIVEALHATLQHFCGNDYNGVCVNFKNSENKYNILLTKISEVAFTEQGNQYKFVDRMGNIPYRYYNLRKSLTPGSNEYSFTFVGEYKPAEDYLYLENFELTNNQTTVMSACPGTCNACLYLFRYQKVMHIPGDILIPAIFDVHYRGDAVYSCADMRGVNGFQYTEAFRFALQRINSGQASVKLNGVTLGGLGFDGCTDPIRASALVTGIYSGAYPKPEMSMDTVAYDASDLAGWLSYDSESTVNVARILQRFGVPIVTPGATTPVLNDKNEFHTFFRTIPSESMVAKAMAMLSQKLGFEYILTINAPEEGSREAVREFRKYAKEMGICVGASYEFNTDGPVEQILRYVNQSSTNVVAVFATPDQYIEELINEKHNNALYQDVVFIANNPWTSAIQDDNSKVPSKTINFMMEGTTTVEAFQSFLADQLPTLNHPNPWFREYYEMVRGCDLAGSYKYGGSCLSAETTSLDEDVLNKKLDLYILTTMNAVYALANGIHATLADKCGATYSNICSKFVSDNDTDDQIMMHMDTSKFLDATNTGTMFEFIKREANKNIAFKRYLPGNRIQNQEGTFNGDRLNIPLEETLKEVYKNTKATCVGQCTQCQQDSIGQEDFYFVYGEVIIGALFDIHKEGKTPYTCGEINDEHGFQLVEAFNWAMDYVNEHKGIFADKLNRVKLGSLIFDTCKSAVRAGNLIANYHARNFEIRTTDYRIDPSFIDLYIGPMMNEPSIRVADVLNELSIPQISYGASTLELRDDRKYKYFMRTVPADDKQARALISFLKKYKLKNIQVISQFSTTGQFGRDEFMRLAPLNQICVTAEYVVGQDGVVDENEAIDVVQKLKSKMQSKMIVLIMDDPYEVLKQANKYSDIVENFAFIATDKWGFGIAGYENLVELDGLLLKKKLVTLDVETADFPELDRYLEAKTPGNYMNYESDPPWFKEYYEYIYKCSFGQPTPKYPQPCRNDMINGYPRSENYIQDPYALYVINAVFSTALGVHETIKEICGSSNTLCQILRQEGEKREWFFNHIKDVKFTDQTDQPFYYTSHGESDRGFHFYQPQAIDRSLYGMETTSGYYWEDIGSFNDTHHLKMDVRYEPAWESTCAAQGSCQCEFPKYQPSRYMAKPSPNDLNIAFISDIHSADPNNKLGCGDIDIGSNMQNLMAFWYAIKLVNDNSESRFPASLKLGGIALDTCSRPGRIGQDVYSLLSGEPICGVNEGTQVVPPASVITYMVRNSENSVAVSSMLSPLKVTSLSMSATSVELSNKYEHPFFLRTVPPDDVQAIVVGQILQKFGWDYVSVVYSDNNYGRSAKDTLLSTSKPPNPSYCFGRTVQMSMAADLVEAKQIIDKLNQQIGSKVVVVFVSDTQVRLLLQATTEKGLNHRFIWLGSDAWADSKLITKGYEETAAGAVTIQIQSEFSSGFREFMKTLTFNDRKGLPDDWFEEIYQKMHQCRILDTKIPMTFTRICSGNEKFTDDMIPQDPYVLHTIISVFQIAHGLSDIQACKQLGLTISSCLALQPNRRQLFYDSLLKAQHDVLPKQLKDNSFTFRFTGEGYGEIGYNILNYRKDLTTGQYEYIKIGTYLGELRLEARNYKSYSFTDLSLPISRCPLGSTCRCEGTSKDFDFTQNGTTGRLVTYENQYLDEKTGLLVEIEDTPKSADRFRDIWALIVITLAAIGAFSGLCMFIYLLVVYPVRGGTTILGYMLCLGTVLMYVLVFAFVVHPSETICGLRRFSLGFVYSICYSAIFVKLVDCWRTRYKEDIYMVKYNKIGNPWGLFFSACLLVLVQVMINAEWLILEEPTMERVIYNNMLWPRCTPDDFYDEGLILSNTYVMFLILLSVLVGLCAYGNDKNHWDCRWLTGCVFLTIPCWMVWCLVAALGEYKMRDAAVAIGLLYNATIMLMCGPLRKLYLLHKYQASVHEQEKLAQRESDYNSMYNRQYDNTPQMHDMGSVRDSTMMGHDDVFLNDSRR